MLEVEQQEEKRTQAVYLLNEMQVDFYWDEIKEALKEVPGFYRYYSEEWAYGQVKMGHLHVWVLSDGQIRGIVLTQMKIYPRRKVLEVVAMSGISMMDYLQELDDVFERFAIAGECDEIAALVRPGLERKLRPHFAEKRAVIVSRDVGNRRDH